MARGKKFGKQNSGKKAATKKVQDIKVSQKQYDFCACMADEVLGGGSAGGGKSIGQLIDAYCYAVKHAGSKQLFIRETFPELQRSLIMVSLSLYPENYATYNATEHKWYWYNGSIIEFGYLESDNDVIKYQSAEYDVIRFDEGTHQCLHPATETLTKNGWKRYYDITSQDEVLSLKPDMTSTWAKVDKVLIYQYDGELIEYNQRSGVSFSVTPGHRMVVRKQNKKEWYFSEIDNIPMSARIMRAAPIEEKPDIEWFDDLPPHQHKCHNEASKIKMDTWLTYLGWYLSEGCCFERKDGHSPQCSIRQMKPCDSLLDVMREMPYRHSVSKDGQYKIYSRQLYVYLKQLGNLYEKRVPKFIFELNKRQIEIFLKAFEKGDGHTSENGAVSIGLANERLIDDLQILYSITGRIASKGYSYIKKFDSHIWRLSVSAEGRHKTEIKANEFIKRRHSGTVWCLYIPEHHNFMVRHNGKVHFTGNSEYRYMYMKSRLRGANNFPKQIKTTTNPGGIGHKFFKSRFGIGTEKPNEPFNVFVGNHPQTGEELYESRCYIPFNVFDNQFLMKDNPGYIKNLMQLPENEKKALLYGSWEIFDDQAFPMFSRAIHVIEPFPIPRHWKRWRSVDNGYNDPFAWYWNAVDEFGTIYTYREYARASEDPKVIYSKQAEKVVEKSTHVELIDGKQVEYQEKFQFTVAGLDAWATHVRDQQGKTLIDYYNDGGVYGFVKAITDRRLRKATIIEYLTPHKDENLPEGSQMVPKVKIFSTCKLLIQDINDAINDPDDPEKYCDDASVGGAHYLDGWGYGLVAYHANRSKGLKVEQSEIAKEKMRLARQYKRGRRYM